MTKSRLVSLLVALMTQLRHDTDILFAQVLFVKHRILTSLMFFVAAVLVTTNAAAERPRYHYDSWDSPYFQLDRCDSDQDDHWLCTSIFAYYEVDDANPTVDYYEFFIDLSTTFDVNDVATRRRLWCQIDPASVELARDATNVVVDVLIDTTTATCLENASYILDSNSVGYRYVGPAFAGIVTFNTSLGNPIGRRAERKMGSLSDWYGDTGRYQCQVYTGWDFQLTEVELNGVSLATNDWQSRAGSGTCPRPPLVAN